MQRELATKNSRATFKTPITVEDVLNSRMIAYPFRLLQCCLVTDGGRALILVAAERARDFPQKPIYLIGTGESVETPMVSQMQDFTSSRAFRVAGPTAFAEAGIAQSDVDHLMIYDAFAHLPIYGLEDLGFVRRGEAGAFIAERNTASRRQAAVQHQWRRPFERSHRGGGNGLCARSKQSDIAFDAPSRWFSAGKLKIC